MSVISKSFSVSAVLSLAACLHAQNRDRPAALENQNPLSTFRSFSANVTGGIARDHDRKIYRLGKLMRLDFDAGYRVTDLETHKMWGIYGDRCFEFTKPDAGTFPFSAYHNFNAERLTTPEEETLEGHVCRIEKVTFTPKENAPIAVHMKLWEAKDLEGFPIRVDIEMGGQEVTSSYNNVSLQPPDIKLFWHPAKCTSAEAPPVSGSADPKPHSKETSAAAAR